MSVWDRCARVHAGGSVWLGNEGKEVSHSSGVAETEGVFPGSSLARRAFTCCNRHQIGARAVSADFTRLMQPGDPVPCARVYLLWRLILRWDGRLAALVTRTLSLRVEGMTAHIVALSLLVRFVCLTRQCRGVSSHRCARAYVHAPPVHRRTDRHAEGTCLSSGSSSSGRPVQL